MKEIEYFHFESPYSGNRYFKVNWIENSVVQVVLNSGVAKKGRPHQLGVTSLAMSSFRGTYHHYFFIKRKKDYTISTTLKITTENQFMKAFDKCIDRLKLK